MMLKIRKSQLGKLTESLDAAYCGKLCNYFRVTYPDLTAKWDDTTLLQVITKSVSNGRQFNVETSKAMLRYVGLAVLVNPDFDKQADVRAFLKAPGLDPDYKVHLLSDMLIENLRSIT